MMNRLGLGISLLIVIVTGLLPSQGEALQGPQLALTQYLLSSSIIGSGSLNNLNQPPTFTCSSPSTSCTGTFAAGTTFTLHASPASGYAFKGWSGCGSITSQGDCSVALSADSSLAATFSLIPLVQITGDQTPYQSLQQACNAANPEARILARNVTLSDSSLTINRGSNLFLKGGLEADFSTIHGESYLPGKLTIRSGSLTVERLVIAGASLAPKTLISLAVAPANPSITAGATQQFSATGSFSDNTKQDLTGSVFWGTTNSSIATMSNAAGSNGLASSLGVGSCIVMAVSGSLSAQTTLTVTPATLISLMVTPANASIAQGVSQQFSASGTFSDGRIQDLTPQVTWTSTGVVQI
jgi:trimeric autotransporter adhesin